MGASVALGPKGTRLRDFLRANLPRMHDAGGAGKSFDHPDYELYARDYLAFSEKELESRDNRALINCVGHLKRAMDCQLDSFLHSYGLHECFSSRNLKFDVRLEFLREAGVFSGRTLSRLNNIRNRIEHAYEIPKVPDLEVYFDLVTAFVAVLERTVLFLQINEREYDIGGDDRELEISGPHQVVEVSAQASPLPSTTRTRIPRYGFTITYESQGPNVKVDWEIEAEQTTLAVTPAEREDFVYFLRVFVLLSQRAAMCSDAHILAQI